MDQRLRDFFVSTLRCGIFIDRDTKIVAPSFSDIIESHHRYLIAYDEALNEGLLTDADAEDWIASNGLWTEKEEMELFDTKNNIDTKKLRMYENRRNSVFVKKERKTLRILENIYSQISGKKSAYYSQTCEAFADSAKLTFILSKTCYVKSRLIDDDYDMNDAIRTYNKSILPESSIRELARTEPWRSLWVASKKVNFKLFLNEDDQDLTINQRNLILWSTTYDNIQESYEPPPESVLEDDDILDGWFIHQRKKREREQKQKSLDEKFGKSKSGQDRSGKTETFVMVNPEEGFSAKEIYSMNDPVSYGVIEQRNASLAKHKSLDYTSLPDIQQEGRISAQNAMKARSSSKGR